MVTLEREIEKGRGASCRRQVAIIGGSASGFFTASLARARRDARSNVLERSEQLDPTAAHAYCHESHAQRCSGRLANTAVVNEIRKFELFTDGRSAQVPLDRPDLIIERARLDSRAGRAGAKQWREGVVRQAVFVPAK
jgi:hypothetical protein